MDNDDPDETKQRLKSHIFDLPVQELRRGYLSDVYFWRAKVSLENHHLDPSVTMQVFQKDDAVICGVDEALAVLKLASGRYTDYEKAYNLFDDLIDLKQQARTCYERNRDRYIQLLEQKMDVSRRLDDLWEDRHEDLQVRTLYDGDTISPWEPVMHIDGPASLFVHLETIYIGILGRRTKIATNVRRVVDAAGDKPILYFPARFDHWAVQGGDGYAASVGGAFAVSTDAQGEWWGAEGAGTIPHALIAAVGGDTVKATKIFGESYPDANLVALVDFNNDCVNTALECARALGDKLWGVRLDTAGNMVDRSIFDQMGDFDPTGVVPELVFNTRQALDSEGFEHVNIVVSGGFDPGKIQRFEDTDAPVDSYGVGSYFMSGSYDFTADVVRHEGQPCAKQGRWYRQNPRLESVKWDDLNENGADCS